MQYWVSQHLHGASCTGHVSQHHIRRCFCFAIQDVSRGMSPTALWTRSDGFNGGDAWPASAFECPLEQESARGRGPKKDLNSLDLSKPKGFDRISHTDAGRPLGHGHSLWGHEMMGEAGRLWRRRDPRRYFVGCFGSPASGRRRKWRRGCSLGLWLGSCVEGDEEVQRKQDDQEEDEEVTKRRRRVLQALTATGASRGSRETIIYTAGCKGYLQCMESIPAQHREKYYESKGARESKALSLGAVARCFNLGRTYAGGATTTDHTLVTGLRHSGAWVCFGSGIGIVADKVGAAVTIIDLREQPFTLSAKKTQSFLVFFGIFGSPDHRLYQSVPGFFLW